MKSIVESKVNIEDDTVTLFTDVYCTINDINLDDDELEKFVSLDIVSKYLSSLPKKILTKEEECKIGYEILEGNEQAKKALLISKNIIIERIDSAVDLIDEKKQKRIEKI